MKRLSAQNYQIFVDLVAKDKEMEEVIKETPEQEKNEIRNKHKRYIKLVSEVKVYKENSSENYPTFAVY